MSALNIIGIVAVFTLGGCVDTFGPIGSKIRPLDDGTFEFVVPAYIDQHDEDLEAKRLAWLGTKISLNGYCPAGHEIIKRLPVIQVRAPAGDAGEIFYRVRCRG